MHIEKAMEIEIVRYCTLKDLLDQYTAEQILGAKYSIECDCGDWHEVQPGIEKYCRCGKVIQMLDLETDLIQVR